MRKMYKPYTMSYAFWSQTMYNYMSGTYTRHRRIQKTITLTNLNATSTICYITVYIFKIEEHAYYEYRK